MPKFSIEFVRTVEEKCLLVIEAETLEIAADLFFNDKYREENVSVYEGTDISKGIAEIKEI